MLHRVEEPLAQTMQYVDWEKQLLLDLMAAAACAKLGRQHIWAAKSYELGHIDKIEFLSQ